MPIPDFSHPEANFSYMPSTYTPAAPMQTLETQLSYNPGPTIPATPIEHYPMLPPREEPGLIHEDPIGLLIGPGSTLLGGGSLPEAIGEGVGHYAIDPFIPEP